MRDAAGFVVDIWFLYAPNSVFWIYRKISSIHFFRICSVMKIYSVFYIPTQIPYLEKSGSWNIGQNALGQSDCRIFNPLMHNVPKWSDTL